MTDSKSQVKRLITQSPEYAAGYKAGREAGMREASEIARKRDLVAGEGQMDAHGIYIAILSAI